MIEEKLELNLPEKNPLSRLIARCCTLFTNIHMHSVVIAATYEYFHEYFLCHLTFMYK